MSEHRPRVVFDCMIFLQAAARRASPSGVCLALAEQVYWNSTSALRYSLRSRT